MPSEPSAWARVHLAPCKCYWPRRIPAPLGVNPQRTGGERGEPGMAALTPPGASSRVSGGSAAAQGAGAGGGRWRGQPAEPPPLQRGRGCYMTRRGRCWAGTHRGCDSCCGYNREPGEGGRDHLRSLGAASTLRGPWGALPSLGHSTPGHRREQRTRGDAWANTAGTLGSAWDPELAPRGRGAGVSRILPQAGRGQRRGPGGCSPPAPARRGGGTKLAPREELNLAHFPASSELRRWAPAGRGATIAAVHLSSRSPALSSPPKAREGSQTPPRPRGLELHPCWAMPLASPECPQHPGTEGYPGLWGGRGGSLPERRGP